MSMRARLPKDYKQGDESNLQEGEGLGVMGGKHRQEMNRMFDTRGRDTESYQRRCCSS